MIAIECENGELPPAAEIARLLEMQLDESYANGRISLQRIVACRPAVGQRSRDKQMYNSHH
jgi:hypothetical protein